MQACGVTGVTAVTGVMLVGRALSWGNRDAAIFPSRDSKFPFRCLLVVTRVTPVTSHAFSGDYFAGIGLFYAIPAK